MILILLKKIGVGIIIIKNGPENFLNYIKVTNLEVRLVVQTFFNFLSKCGGFLYGMFLLPSIYASTSAEITVEIYAYSSILLWFLSDLGLTEAVKNKLISNKICNPAEKKRYICNFFSLFIYSSIFYFFILLIVFSVLNSFTYDFSFYKLFYIFILSLFIFPQKFFREYLTSENKIDRFFITRIISMIACILPTIYFTNNYSLNFYSSLLFLNIFSILSTIIFIIRYKYLIKLVKLNKSFIKDVINDKDTIKTSFYLFIFGIISIGTQDSAILIFKNLYDAKQVADYNILSKLCQYLIVINSLFILPIWPYITRKSLNVNIVSLLMIISLISLIIMSIIFLSIFNYRYNILHFLSANEYNRYYQLETLTFFYFFLKSFSILLSAFLKILGYFRHLVIFSGFEFIFFIISIYVAWYLNLNLYFLIMLWTFTLFFLRILMPYIFIIKNIRNS